MPEPDTVRFLATSLPLPKAMTPHLLTASIVQSCTSSWASSPTPKASVPRSADTC